MKRILLAILLIAAVAAMPGMSSAGPSLGVGLHYLHNVADIDAEETLDLNKDSWGLIGSLQYDPGLIMFEGQVEYIFNFLGSDEAMWLPQAWALIGGLVYGGAGIGIGYIDGDFTSDPFYGLRAGVNLPLGGVHLDAYGTYQFWNDDEWTELTNEDLDSITFATVLRFDLGGGDDDIDDQ